MSRLCPQTYGGHGRINIFYHGYLFCHFFISFMYAPYVFRLYGGFELCYARLDDITLNIIIIESIMTDRAYAQLYFVWRAGDEAPARAWLEIEAVEVCVCFDERAKFELSEAGDHGGVIGA